MLACREALNEKIRQKVTLQAAVQKDLRHAQALSQAAFKESQDMAASLDAEHLQSQAILADRVSSATTARFLRLTCRCWTSAWCARHCQLCLGALLIVQVVCPDSRAGWLPVTIAM